MYVTRAEKIRGESLKRVLVPRVELKNKSRRFLEAFNEACSLVLQRKRVKIAGPNKEGHFMVRYVAKDFVAWWQGQTLNSLREVIEKFPIEYL